MRQNTDITSFVWDYLKIQDTKIAKRVLNALDYDIATFIDYGTDELYIEKVCSYSVIPNYVYNYIKRHQLNILAFANDLIK